MSRYSPERHDGAIGTRQMLNRRWAGSSVGFVVLAFGVGACGGGATQEADGGASSTEPAARESQLVVDGQRLYEQNCAVCHGTDLKGTRTGPPFLSPIYAPNHHSDESFFAAVANGVQPHHWDFGPMPPQPSVEPEDVSAIVAYVRAQQEDKGIFEDPSHP